MHATGPHRGLFTSPSAHPTPTANKSALPPICANLHAPFIFNLFHHQLSILSQFLTLHHSQTLLTHTQSSSARNSPHSVRVVSEMEPLASSSTSREPDNVCEYYVTDSSMRIEQQKSPARPTGTPSGCRGGVQEAEKATLRVEGPLPPYETAYGG